MDHPTHQSISEESKMTNAERTSAFTIRIPKPNWQITALLLIALIAGFQMIQLARLKSSVSTTASAATTTAASAAPSTAASSSSGLDSQVGSC